jgi:hypothetical protein
VPPSLHPLDQLRVGGDDGRAHLSGEVGDIGGVIGEQVLDQGVTGHAGTLTRGADSFSQPL